jgi:hypothetical protein
MNRAIFFIIFCILCCGYGIVRGGKPEKIAGTLLLTSAVASVILQLPENFRFRVFDTGMFAVDIVLLGGLLLLAIISNRFWPIWLSAMQLLTVTSHPAILIRPDVIPYAYWKAVTLWSYPMLLLLAWGAFCRHQRMKTKGVDICWKKPVFF